MAKGVHLFPSRTQKLSPYTSKVLGWKRPGRIDSCRLKQIRHTSRYALFVYLLLKLFSVFLTICYLPLFCLSITMMIDYCIVEVLNIELTEVTQFRLAV